MKLNRERDGWAEERLERSIEIENTKENRIYWSKYRRSTNTAIKRREGEMSRAEI